MPGVAIVAVARLECGAMDPWRVLESQRDGALHSVGRVAEAEGGCGRGTGANWSSRLP